MAHLEIKQLSKRFGGFTALDGIDLSVAQGEFVVLLGPSGCGKTTLLRAIAGLERQDSGQIWHAGRDISHAPPAQRDYGIVFQSYALFPNLPVGDNVACGIKSRRTGHAAGAVGGRAPGGEGGIGGGGDLVAVGSVGLVLGCLMVIPALLVLVGRLGTHLALPLRLAARDTARQRGRSTPAVAAIMAAVAPP